VCRRRPQDLGPLLLAVLWEIGRKRRRPFGPALTSREILPRSGLTDEARDSLGGLVRAVEENRFGGVGLDLTRYEDCAERYRRVVDSLAGGDA